MQSSTPPAHSHRLCIAPMMQWTDRHFRYFLRLLSPHAFLYTEMVTAAAVVHGDAPRFLRFDPIEHPVALQLGGSDARLLAKAAALGAAAGFDEINLNVGCPSDRVQSGQFGACLMLQPELVAEGVRAMRDQVDIPVTVKTRLGVDEHDSYQFLLDFVGPVAEAGCELFIVHARKALLNGLSPKQNREIPPLDYTRVHQLRRDMPALQLVLNGGLSQVSEMQRQLEHVHGVMIGREAYRNPYHLHEAEQVLFGLEPAQLATREQALSRYQPYVRGQLAQGERFWSISRHLLGLFQGCAGARRWRTYLSTHGTRAEADEGLLEQALQMVRTMSAG